MDPSMRSATRVDASEGADDPCALALSGDATWEERSRRGRSSACAAVRHVGDARMGMPY